MSTNILEVFFFTIGCIFVLRLCLESGMIIWSLLACGKISQFKKGNWAVVTACTDGLGLGFSETLAKQGFNIIQVGRNPTKLKNVARMISSTYNVEVTSILKDFSKCNENPIDFFKDIESQVGDREISIIVNNVGKGGVFPFLHSQEVILEQLALNIFPIVFLTRMLSNRLNKQKYAGIININSIASVTPLQKNVVYCASKAFGFVFSRVLASEFSLTNNISVVCAQPALIDTPATQNLQKKTLMISKYTCAENIIRSLGSLSYTSGHWKHVIMYLTMNAAAFVIPWFGEHFSKGYENN